MGKMRRRKRNAEGACWGMGDLHDDVVYVMISGSRDSCADWWDCGGRNELKSG